MTSPRHDRAHFDLERFLEAQAPVYAQVCSELRAGRKRSHWMWFIFPQIRGLGRSSMAERFAIASVDEAAAYLDHPLLGTRFRECTRLVLGVEERSVEEIFGYPDHLKSHSSMTLFARAGEGEKIFLDALAKFFGGAPDPATLALI